jgi:general secretion pathway protein E
VEPFLVASSLMGVLAQRLVRVLCKDCRVPYVPEPEELKEIGLTPEQVRETTGGMIYKPEGCEQCNRTGYRGRSGIYEVMLIDDDIRQLVLKNVDSGTIKRQAVTSKGMRTLMDDGALKVLKGVTSIAEVLSVTQEDIN